VSFPVPPEDALFKGECETYALEFCSPAGENYPVNPIMPILGADEDSEFKFTFEVKSGPPANFTFTPAVPHASAPPEPIDPLTGFSAARAIKGVEVKQEDGTFQRGVFDFADPDLARGLCRRGDVRVPKDVPEIEEGCRQATKRVPTEGGAARDKREGEARVFLESFVHSGTKAGVLEVRAPLTLVGKLGAVISGEVRLEPHPPGAGFIPTLYGMARSLTFGIDKPPSRIGAVFPLMHVNASVPPPDGADSWRFIDCELRATRRDVLEVHGHAKVVVEKCLLGGQERTTVAGCISCAVADDTAHLRLINSTLVRGSEGLRCGGRATVSAHNCMFRNHTHAVVIEGSNEVTLQALSFRHIKLGPVLVTHENNNASLTYGNLECGAHPWGSVLRPKRWVDLDLGRESADATAS
ncbi:hypothetical protein T484DRAFT_1930774, partial [Baffinella frigidus]